VVEYGKGVQMKKKIIIGVVVGLILALLVGGVILAGCLWPREEEGEWPVEVSVTL